MERFFYKVSVNHEGLMVEGNPWECEALQGRHQWEVAA
jgi:hypothetical protein